MADESLPQPPDDGDDDQLTPDTEIPVRIDSLEADGTRPSVGDSVTIKIDGTVKKIENDYVYLQPDAINDTDINDILAETGSQDENDDSMMQKLTAQADQMGTPMGGGY
jgi:hypothetical protein